MPAPTFYDVCMGMRLYAPNAPWFLVQKWVRDSFAQLADRRQWSWMLLQGQLVWADARDLAAVTTTFGSTTVTSAGLFVASDEGRNFRVGTYPIYTIVTFTDANTIVLDRAYEGTAQGAVAAQILDAYATVPANFQNFLAILDPVNQRLIPWWATWEELALIDPDRMAAESVPRLLAAASPSVVATTLGQPQYEYYPKPTTRGALQYYAKKTPIGTNLTDLIPAGLVPRIDIIEAGALAACAKWPGTEDLKNPYFNLALSREHQAEFDRGADQLDIRDDDLYPQSFDKIPWQRWSTYGWAYDTNLLRETDATLASYWGTGWY